MTREEAYVILKNLVKNENLIKHHFACEAVMRALYLKLNPEPNTQAVEEWGIVGLLHDADYELSKDHPEKHTIILRDKLGNKINSNIMHAIMSHNSKFTKIEPENLMDWSIYCCDELTGLIIAAALVNPDKKLSSVTLDFVMNRFKEKSFAKGADRDQIRTCEEKLQIPLNDFVDLSLKAMQQIAPSLGL